MRVALCLTIYRQTLIFKSNTTYSEFKYIHEKEKSQLWPFSAIEPFTVLRTLIQFTPMADYISGILGQLLLKSHI